MWAVGHTVGTLKSDESRQTGLLPPTDSQSSRMPHAVIGSSTRVAHNAAQVGVWFHVDARAKTIDSLVKKLLTKQHHTFETLPDKVGARVIIRYRADVDKVVDKSTNTL